MRKGPELACAASWSCRGSCWKRSDIVSSAGRVEWLTGSLRILVSVPSRVNSSPTWPVLVKSNCEASKGALDCCPNLPGGAGRRCGEADREATKLGPRREAGPVSTGLKMLLNPLLIMGRVTCALCAKPSVADGLKSSVREPGALGRRSSSGKPIGRCSLHHCNTEMGCRAQTLAFSPSLL